MKRLRDKNGFTGIEIMAALTLVTILCATLIAVNGCTGMYPKPTTPLCAAPEAVGSVLCAIGVKSGTTPEQMNDMLLDASLIGIGTKVTTGTQMKEAVAKVQKYVATAPTLSVNLIIGYLVKEAKIDPALALLLSRRLVFLQVPVLEVQAFTPFDKSLVEKHLANQMDQLNFF